MSEEYNKLYEYFKSFPGIGKRQAERFVFHVLTKDEYWVESFIKEIRKAKENIHECADCCRVFRNKYGENFNFCDICRSQVRNRSILAIVEKNIDAEVLLKKGSWTGLVFVLGGQIPVIERKTSQKINLEKLLNFIKKLKPGPEDLQEIILCTSLNPDGVFTASILKQKIDEFLEKDNLAKIKITTFGRGFSTGTELEYADKDTLQNALQNRTENIY